MEWCKEKKKLSENHRIYLENFLCFCEECTPRPKEDKKLWEILRDCNPCPERLDKPHLDVFKHQAQAAIEAVIKVYEEWYGLSDFDSTFKDYLKEKLL